MTKKELLALNANQRDSLFLRSTRILQNHENDFTDDPEYKKIVIRLANAIQLLNSQGTPEALKEKKEAYIELDLFIINKAEEIRLEARGAA